MIKSLALASFVGLVFILQNIECKRPVVLLPGDGGSRMLAKLDKPKRSHLWCEKKTDGYFNIWLNIKELLPFSVECLVDNMRLHYNSQTRKTRNTMGVDIKIPGFGDTTSIEYLDTDHYVTPGHYYASVVSNMVGSGYKKGQDLRGAPYDFRKAPNEQDEFFASLKNLIEETYMQNGNKSTVLVGHSMGCAMLLYFLSHQSQGWKDQHVRSLVTLSGPYAGSVKSVLTFTSGYNLGNYFLNPLSVRPEQRTNPSLSFFLPSPDYWRSSEVLVKTPQKEYTVNDYKELFSDISWDTGYEMWLDTKDLISNKRPPGVEVHCLHGTGVKTPASLLYNNDFPDSKPSITYGDGDGTVNLRSLEACTEWAKYQVQKVHHKTFFGVNHMGMLRNADAVKYITDLVNSQ